VPNLTVSAVAGASRIGTILLSLTAPPRSLYLYENDGINALAVSSRELYLYENDAINALSVAERALYLYENDGINALVWLARSLYAYEQERDLPVQPWLMKLDPPQQYPMGAVNLWGDGLGQYAEVAGASTVTASSTNGGNLPANTVSHTSATAYWQSSDGTGAWIRYTLATARDLFAVAIEDVPNPSANTWGTPLFRFSDGGADVIGGSPVPAPAPPDRTPEFPVGSRRTLYVLPSLRTGITWVEVRVASGGTGTARGLSQAWVYADEGQGAEASVPVLNALAMGAAGTWLGRSPGLWPANSGLPVAKAVTVVVPALGLSGLVKVQES
jgi:hypothetical protein